MKKLKGGVKFAFWVHSLARVLKLACKENALILVFLRCDNILSLHDDAKIPDLDWQGLNGCQTTWHQRDGYMADKNKNGRITLPVFSVGPIDYYT